MRSPCIVGSVAELLVEGLFIDGLEPGGEVIVPCANAAPADSAMTATAGRMSFFIWLSSLEWRRAGQPTCGDYRN